MVSGTLIKQTKLAYLVECRDAETGDDKEVWFPRSQLKYVSIPGDGTIVMDVPEWLREAKGVDDDDD